MTTQEAIGVLEGMLQAMMGEKKNLAPVVKMEIALKMAIENLKEAWVPVENKGEWIAEDIHNCCTKFKCSKCGYIHNFTHLYGKPTADYAYCPNCGKDMRGEKNGNA